MLSKRLLVSLLLLFAAVCYADDNEIESPNESVEKSEAGFVPFVLPFYTPETNWAVGGMLVYYSYPEHRGEAVHVNEFQVKGAATKNKQYAIGVSMERYIRDGEFKLLASFDADKWPDSFWGTGPYTIEDAKEDYTDATFYLHSALLRKFSDRFYLGPFYRYRKIVVTKTQAGGLLGTGEIEGSEGTFNTGPGMHLNYDSRDNKYYPQGGIYLNLLASTYPKILGSDYSFSKLELDFRYYLQPYKAHVLALQAKGNFSSGTVPFQSLYKSGGDEILRGVNSGRYRDRQYVAGQLEYRMPLVWRFESVIFASAGELAHSLSGLNSKNLIYSWGGGLRFVIDEKEHINFRLDLGFNETGGPMVYLTVKEAF